MKKGALCVGECSITVEQDSAACICEAVLKTDANSNAQKIQRGMLFVQEEKSG